MTFGMSVVKAKQKGETGQNAVTETELWDISVLTVLDGKEPIHIWVCLFQAIT